MVLVSASASVRTRWSTSARRRRVCGHRRRHECPGEPGSSGLGQAAVDAGHHADLPGQPQLTEDDQIGRHHPSRGGRSHGQRHAQIHRRLGDADAADGGHEDLGRSDHHLGAAAQHRQQQRDPRGVDAHRARPRPHRTGTEQGLHLHQQRPPALQHRDDDAARDAGHAVPQEHRAGVRHGPQAVVTHLEDPHFAGGAETVLDRGQDAQGVVAVAVEGEDGVDEMLHGPRAGQIAVLGHVADEDDGHAGRLGQPGEPVDARSHLGQAAGRPGDPSSQTVCMESTTTRAGR